MVEIVWPFPETEQTLCLCVCAFRLNCMHVNASANSAKVRVWQFRHSSTCASLLSACE